MRVAIHQSCFFPWLGTFHKAARVDRFLMFDHVQAPGGKSWITRNRIALNGETRWFTLPIHRKGLQPVAELRINYSTDFTRKHLGTLTQAYGKARHFDEVFPFISGFYHRRYETVLDFNVASLIEISRRLGIATEFVPSQGLMREHPRLSALAGNELVLESCAAAGGTTYVSGSGCLDFIDPPSFAARGIGFWFQDFRCREYPQPHRGPFLSQLSVLDVLFNVGFAGAAELIREPMLVAPEEMLRRPAHSPA